MHVVIRLKEKLTENALHFFSPILLSVLTLFLHNINNTKVKCKPFHGWIGIFLNWKYYTHVYTKNRFELEFPKCKFEMCLVGWGIPTWLSCEAKYHVLHA